MSYPQYGLYLIPPPHLLYPIGLAHQLLAAEFNARTAGRFMVHCTVKGFFKLAEGASPADFGPALDDLFARHQAFETEIKGIYSHESGTYGATILLMLERTEGLHGLHNAVWDVVEPYIAPGCRFSSIEMKRQFFMPHITLGMADVPREPGLLAQATALGEHIYNQLPKGSFLARDMQLIEFYSEDWDGAWWETLRYNQLKGWQL